MRRKITAMFVWGAAAMLALTACTKESSEIGAGKGEGSLRISASAVPQIGVSSQTRATQIPLTDFMGGAAAKFTQEWAMGSMRTRVVCVEVDNAEGLVFGSADEFNYENPALSPVAALYNVTMGSLSSDRKRLPRYTTPAGSISAEEAPKHRYEHPEDKLIPEVAEGEGVDFIYFEGWNTCTVQANGDTQVDVEVRVANTVVTVEFTEAFRDYFANGATVTLKTKNGLTAEISGYAAGAAPSRHYFWVRPQQFTLSAVATPQDPSSTLTAEPITFDDYVRTDVAPQTLYRIVYDIEKTGGVNGKITVTVDDTPIYTEDLGTIETNPNDENYDKE